MTRNLPPTLLAFTTAYFLGADGPAQGHIQRLSKPSMHRLTGRGTYYQNTVTWKDLRFSNMQIGGTPAHPMG
jgi:hypothetical protein